MTRRTWILAMGVVAVAAIVATLTGGTRKIWEKFVGKPTVKDRVQAFEGAVRGRLEDAFRAQGLEWGKGELAFLGYKEERVLEVYGRKTASDSWRRIRRKRPVNPWPRIAGSER